MVYVNSEDGNVYSTAQGHTGGFTVPAEKIFLNRTIGAAYTPSSLGPYSKLCAQNDGTCLWWATDSQPENPPFKSALFADSG